MENQELKTNDPRTDDEPELRPWITPSFEREELKNALSSGVNYTPLDAPYHQS
jgi:hypothetical protein